VNAFATATKSKPNSSQKINKQTTQKHKNIRRMVEKNLSMMILHPPLD
jgi:hypothetical protein